MPDVRRRPRLAWRPSGQFRRFAEIPISKLRADFPLFFFPYSPMFLLPSFFAISFLLFRTDIFCLLFSFPEDPCFFVRQLRMTQRPRSLLSSSPHRHLARSLRPGLRQVAVFYSAPLSFFIISYSSSLLLSFFAKGAHRCGPMGKILLVYARRFTP